MQDITTLDSVDLADLFPGITPSAPFDPSDIRSMRRESTDRPTRRPRPGFRGSRANQTRAAVADSLGYSRP